MGSRVHREIYDVRHASRTTELDTKMGRPQDELKLPVRAAHCTVTPLVAGATAHYCQG